MIPAGFKNAMLDDLNTPMALAELFSLSKQANTATDLERKEIPESSDASLRRVVRHILQQDPEHWFQGVTHANDVDASKIERNDRRRVTPQRLAKDWSVADRDPWRAYRDGGCLRRQRSGHKMEIGPLVL